MLKTRSPSCPAGRPRCAEGELPCTTMPSESGWPTRVATIFSGVLPTAPAANRTGRPPWRCLPRRCGAPQTMALRPESWPSARQGAPSSVPAASNSAFRPPAWSPSTSDGCAVLRPGRAAQPCAGWPAMCPRLATRRGGCNPPWFQRRGRQKKSLCHRLRCLPFCGLGRTLCFALGHFGAHQRQVRP